MLLCVSVGFEAEIRRLIFFDALKFNGKISVFVCDCVSSNYTDSKFKTVFAYVKKIDHNYYKVNVLFYVYTLLIIIYLISFDRFQFCFLILKNLTDTTRLKAHWCI